MLQHPFTSHTNASLRHGASRHGTATAVSCVTSTQRHGIVIAPPVSAIRDTLAQCDASVNPPSVIRNPLDLPASAAPQQIAPRAVRTPLMCLVCLGDPRGAHWLGGCRFCSRGEPAGAEP